MPALKSSLLLYCYGTVAIWSATVSTGQAVGRGLSVDALTRPAAYERWQARNAAAAHSGKWPQLRIALFKAPNLPDLSPEISKYLMSAIHNLGMLISVRQVSSSSRKADLSNIAKTIASCTKNPKFLTVDDPLVIESFIPSHQIVSTLAKDERIADTLLNLGNFFLILQADQEICQDDKFLLAAAAPCPQSNVDEERPLLGRLIICRSSSAWRNFRSTFDLFRHEILHALGFGLLVPRDDEAGPDAKYYKWKLFAGRRSIPYQAHFMDFAESATEYAKKHFACSQIDGIEAEDEHKIHLNEYIFGNELMTPVVNNGPNYFTEFTAQILEHTHQGDKPWYSTNAQLVKRESRAYWWARGAGCRFLNASCFELIDRRDRQRNRVPMFPLEADDEDANWTTAFCTEEELVLELQSKAAKRLCFWNGSAVVRFEAHCKASRHLQMRPLFYEPLSLQSQFPAVTAAVGVGRRSLYGSDYDHRYCPLTVEMLDGSLDDIPYDARLVDCATIPNSAFMR